MLAESLSPFLCYRIRLKAFLSLLGCGLVSSAAAASPAWENGSAAHAFTVTAGIITAASRTDAGESRLVAQLPVQDFILEFEFRQDANAPAASVELRSRDQAGPGSGFSCSLSGADFAGAGALAEPAGRGWLYPLASESARATPGAWNRFRIEAIGSSVRTWVNGHPVAHINDASTRAGRLALHLAPAGTATGKSEWRSVQLHTTALQPAPADPLFIRSFLLNQLTDAELAQGWRLLWDGTSTTGWRGAHRKIFPAGGWRIEQGELILASTPPGEKRPGGDLVTEELFSAFELQLEFQITSGANSGIKYFVTEDIVPASGITAMGLEYQLLDDARHPDALRGVNGDRKLGSLYDIFPAIPPPAVTGLTPVIGEWQHARIIVHPDQHVEHWLNGVQVVDYVRNSPEFIQAVARSAYGKFPNFGRAPAGRLLLQDHGDEVRFRNIKVRLPAP